MQSRQNLNVREISANRFFTLQVNRCERVRQSEQIRTGLAANETLYQPSYTSPNKSGSENYAGDSQLMQNTKIRGQGNFGSRSIGIGLPSNAATAGQVGGLVVNRDLLWWWRDRRLSFAFKGVV